MTPPEPVDDETAWSMVAEVLAANRYAVLSTADASGLPWVSPVYVAHDGAEELLWVSRPGTTHSTNIAARPEIAIVVFDSTQTVGTGRAVYVRAIAGPVCAEDLEAAIATYSTRSVVDGAGVWDAERLRRSGLTLYRAAVHEVRLLPGDGGPDIPQLLGSPARAQEVG